MHFFRELQHRILLIMVLLSSCTLSHAELPVLGDPTQQELTPFREYLMGRNFYRTLRANVDFVDDLEVNDYINSLGRKLTSHSASPDSHFRFFVIKIPSINAFAGPDGYIGFHSGLILEAENESEFAGVMAHEISHVTQRHLARRMTDSSANAGTMFATILAGILVASQNPEAGAALLYGGQAALIQSQINFTRANEHEADRIGISVLRDAGINPQGMASFFNTLLQQSERDNVLAQMEYLRTHPLSTTRIAEASNRIKESDRQLPDDSIDYQFSRARIAVQTTASKKQLINKILALPENQQNLLSRYTLGLAYLSDMQTEKAISILKPLSETHKHPWIKLALSDAYMANHDTPVAQQLLSELNALYPNYLPVSIRYARILLDTHNHDQAIQLLNQQLRTQKEAIVYNTLAKAYFSKGQVSLAMEATSFEYELEGHLKLAAQQVNNALQQPGLNKLTIQRLESRKQTLTMRIKKEAN